MPQRHSAKMAELAPDLYKELLKYKTQESNYFRQTIDLSIHKGNRHQSKAA